MGGQNRRKTKQKNKVRKHVTSLLAGDSEAFQARIDDVTVKDVSFLNRPAKKTEVPVLEDKEPTEAPAYQQLVALCSSKKGIFQKRKLEEEGQGEEELVEMHQKKKRKKNPEDEDIELADPEWMEIKHRREQELQAQAKQSKMLMEEDEDYVAPADDESMEDVLGDGDDDIVEDTLDPYTQHYEKQLQNPSTDPKPFTELAPIELGRVWSDTLKELPMLISASYMKQNLIGLWNTFYHREFKKNRKKRPHLRLTSLQQHLMPIISSYQDFCFLNQNHLNKKEIRSILVLHALNHVNKISDRIRRHSSRLKKLATEQPNHEIEYRDQGFTRPKVLFLLATRNDCFEIVETLIKISGQESIGNKGKFLEEFWEETYVPFSRKPDDWMSRFTGNMDDSFRVGIQIHPKEIKLFSEFYKSDILLVSPLGLKLSIQNNELDVDFLSSIEMVIFDQAENHLMQNWEHVLYIFQEMNKMPKEIRPDTDISRIRMSSLEGQAKFFRQNLFFSEIEHVDLNSLFKRLCYNHQGKIKIQPSSGDGTISKVIPQIKQHFQRLECDNIAEITDFRFNYFVEQVYPHLLTDVLKGTMIFIPSYFDFVRVRNFLRVKRKKGDLTFVQCCEYSPGNQIARNRSNFFHGERDVMLYTERFHFFHRYAIRGIKKIIFYAPPMFKNFYPEMLNLLDESATCLCLFSKFDIYQLEPVLGEKRTKRLFESEKSYHMCC